MKRITALILCVLMLLPLLSACEISVTPKEEIPANGNQTESENENPGGDNGTTPGDSSNGIDLSGIDLSDPIDEDGINWATYDWNDYNPADLFVSLGNATFTVDNSATATGNFTPGETLSLSVTDGAGATWTLEIPAGALLTEETITMTALRDITADGVFDKMDGGVQFSPDGLSFFEPATLTVKGGAFGEDSILVQGNHDGRNIVFTEYEASAESVSATIWHFSTGYWGHGGLAGTNPAARYQFEKALKAADNVLSQPLRVPTPPDFSFKCDAKFPTDAMKKYINEYFEPELPVIRALAAAYSAFMGQSTSLVITDLYLEVKLMLYQRFTEKTNAMIEKYKYQEEKFIPVYGTIFAAMSGIEELGGKLNLDEFHKWGKEIWNYWMRKLVEEHDYDAAHALENVILQSVVKQEDGYSSVDKEFLWLKLGNALTFRVEWELEEHVFFTICSKGEVEVSMNTRAVRDYFGEGDGEGHLASFSDPDGNVYVTAFPSFSNKAQLSNFDPCRNKAITVAVDKFGLDFTAYADTDMGPMPIPFTDYPKPIIHYVDGNAVLTTGFFTFKLDLINFSEKCADSSITAQQEELSHTLDFKIFHQPKDDVYMK